MRGEEVQLLGAVAAGLIDADGVACHPGTHAKWVRLQAGGSAPFRTVKSGELFQLLRRSGILAPQLQGSRWGPVSQHRHADLRIGLGFLRGHCWRVALVGDPKLTGF